MGDWCELAWELRMWSKMTFEGLRDVRKGFNCMKNGIVCKGVSTYLQRTVELKTCSLASSWFGSPVISWKVSGRMKL